MREAAKQLCKPTTSVPVSASFIELDAATALHLAIISLYSDYQFIKERNYDM